MHQTGKFARPLSQPWEKVYENQVEQTEKYFSISQKCHFFSFDLFSLCHTEMKLQTFNNFNLKKKKREWFTSVNSLLSKYLLWDVGGACPNAKVKSSRAGMGPSSSIHFPVKCPHQKPVVCSALVHTVLFFYWSSILDLGNGYCWKICQIVSVKVEMFQFQQICYPPVEKHFTKKFPACSTSEFAL